MVVISDVEDLRARGADERRHVAACSEWHPSDRIGHHSLRIAIYRRMNMGMTLVHLGMDLPLGVPLACRSVGGLGIRDMSWAGGGGIGRPRLNGGRGTTGTPARLGSSSRKRRAALVRLLGGLTYQPNETG